MEIPTLPTFIDGVLVDAQDLVNLNNAIQFLLSPPRVQVEQTGAQAIANNVDVTLTWDQVNEDNDGLFSPGATDRVTIQTPGWYLVSASVAFDSNTTGGREFYVAKNGTRLEGVTLNAPKSPPNGQFAGLAQTTVLLSRGDYVGIIVRQNTGGSLSTLTSAADGRRNVMSLRWIGLQ